MSDADRDEDLRAWRTLTERPDLLDLAGAAPDSHDLKTLGQLRRTCSPALARAAVSCAEGRRRLEQKVADPGRYFADRLGAEQATRLSIARYKAVRFGAVAGGSAVDLCCGIGLDACGLAEVLPVLAVDRDPLRAWMTRRNLSLHAAHPSVVAVADVEKMDLSRLAGSLVHIDPDRRPGPQGRHQRRQTWDRMQPGPEFLHRLIRHARATAIKLSPAVDFSLLPEGHVELIGAGGTVSQTVLWCGDFSCPPSGWRSVARIAENGGSLCWSAPAEEEVPSLEGPDEAGTFLLEVDPLIERAGLLGALCHELSLQALHPQVGLLTAEQASPSPWLKSWQQVASMPWREDKVRRWLKEHQAGIVTVRTRGGTADADRLTRVLSGSGDQPYTLFIVRHEQRVMAYLTVRA